MKYLFFLIVLLFSQNVAAQSTFSNAQNYTASSLGIGTATPLSTLDANGPIKTKGYAIGSLPTGVVGMKAYVTDQLTTCAGAGVALTAGGLAVCPVFYNGSAWVGD